MPGCSSETKLNPADSLASRESTIDCASESRLSKIGHLDAASRNPSQAIAKRTGKKIAIYSHQTRLDTLTRGYAAVKSRFSPK
jgi:hypothetical protein